MINHINNYDSKFLLKLLLRERFATVYQKYSKIQYLCTILFPLKKESLITLAFTSDITKIFKKNVYIDRRLMILTMSTLSEALNVFLLIFFSFF